MNGMVERIWGYDLRVCGEELEKFSRWFFDSDVRGSLVLNREEILPRSVDSAIWPSVFENYVFPNERLAAIRGFAEERGTVDNVGGLWFCLEELKAVRSSLGIEGTLTAVTCFIPPDATVDEVPSPHLYIDCDPMELPPDFRLIGYDIANASTFSGFANCGYASGDLALRILANPAVRLNGYGLIEGVAAALEMLRITLERTGVHGPFFVFGVYVMGDGDVGGE